MCACGALRLGVPVQSARSAVAVVAGMGVRKHVCFLLQSSAVLALSYIDNR